MNPDVPKKNSKRRRDSSTAASEWRSYIPNSCYKQSGGGNECPPLCNGAVLFAMRSGFCNSVLCLSSANLIPSSICLLITGRRRSTSV